MLTRGPFVRDQRLEVGLLLDLRTLVVAAAMTGEHLCTVGDAHLVGVGKHRQRAAHMRVRDGIIVQIEPDVRYLAGVTVTCSSNG